MAEPLGAVPPAIGALSGVPATAFGPSSGVELLQALGDAPQLMADQQLKRLTTQNQVHTQAETALQNLLSAGRTNSALLNDPRYAMQVQQAYGALGLQMPRTANGAFDISKAPQGVEYGSLSADDMLKYAALSPDTRRALVSGAPESFYTMPADAMMTGATQLRASQDVASEMGKMAAGQISPQQFATFVQSQRKYLSADDIQRYTDPTFLENSMSAYGEAQLNKLNAQGMSLRVTAQSKADMVKYLQWKFKQQMGEKVNYDDHLFQKWSADEQALQTRLQQGQERLNIANQQLDLNKQLIGARVNNMQAGQAIARLRTGVQAYNSIQKNLTDVEKAIQNAYNNHVVPDQSLVDLYSSLKDQQRQLGGDLQNQQAGLNVAPQMMQQLGGVLNNIQMSPETLIQNGGERNTSVAKYKGKTYEPGSVIRLGNGVYDGTTGAYLGPAPQ